MKHALQLLATGLLLASAAQAQTKLTIPPLSPATHIRQSFSTSYIDLTYSRPSLRGRVAFGNLIPNGTVWRTGANTITKVRFGEEVKINGQTVPAGGVVLLVTTLISATCGLAAVGTLYGGLAAGLTGRETLLPLLTFPAVAPVLIGATRAVEAALGTAGAVVSDGWPWVGLLAVFAVAFGVGGALAFGPLIDE